MDFVLDKELNRACRILFGSEVVINRDFLYYIQPAGAASAFRKKAFLTHPDRYCPSDKRSMEINTSLFIETKWAYDQIRKFFKEREKKSVSYHRTKRTLHKPQGKTEQKHRKKERQTASGKMNFYDGSVPGRKLLFGEFLYYSHVVSWEAFTLAVFLQRKERPRFGDIAKRWRYLTQSGIRTILSKRNIFEPIGEASARMHALSQFQVNTILYYQRLVQKPLGEYFIENGCLSKSMLNRYLQNLNRHNVRFCSQ